MRVARGLTSSNSGSFNSSGRIFRRESTITNNGSANRSSTKWQTTKKPLCSQYSNAKNSKSSLLNNSRNIRRQTPKSNNFDAIILINHLFLANIFDTLYRFREKIVELLFSIQLRILDFILEPAEKLFPNDMSPVKHPIQRFGGCPGVCCRAAHLPANRSQSASSMLPIKSRGMDRRHLQYSMQRRTVSENWNFN